VLVAVDDNKYEERELVKAYEDNVVVKLLDVTYEDNAEDSA
jgi:hypothetical protein